MRGYVKTTDDNGGVHVNAGIPNHAFYRAAIAIGGYAWEKAGRIWYDVVCNGPLTADSRFADFARLTTVHATKLFGRGSAELAAVVGAWTDVGIDVGKAAAARRPKAKRAKTPARRRATTTARRARR
jgi:Zn-dependent metalloprotease